jgi:oxygen-independent coproporphyrinogen-3 oxidase
MIKNACYCLLRARITHFEHGWVEVVAGRLRLTDPQGFLFSNVVLADLFAQL